MPFKLPGSYTDFSTNWEDVNSMLEKLELQMVITKGNHLHFRANPYSICDFVAATREFSMPP